MIESDDCLWLPLIASVVACSDCIWLPFMASPDCFRWLLIAFKIASPLQNGQELSRTSVNSKNCPYVQISVVRPWFGWFRPHLLIRSSPSWSGPARWFRPLWTGSDQHFRFEPEKSGLNQPRGSDHFGLVQTSISGTNQKKVVWTSHVVHTTLDWFKPAFPVWTGKKWYKPARWFKPHRWFVPLFPGSNRK